MWGLGFREEGLVSKLRKGCYIGTILRVIKGDTGGLDYGSYTYPTYTETSIELPESQTPNYCVHGPQGILLWGPWCATDVNISRCCWDVRHMSRCVILIIIVIILIIRMELPVPVRTE